VLDVKVFCRRRRVVCCVGSLIIMIRMVSTMWELETGKRGKDYGILNRYFAIIRYCKSGFEISVIFFCI
jgi:hypothetical protein